mmetsp:Transcript_41006/g.76241  ORF Transcript_41006/g.76241 Transcript_41006/m.76241 type:complete len:149 (+) Transcript_41006:44-490(+)
MASMLQRVREKVARGLSFPWRHFTSPVTRIREQRTARLPSSPTTASRKIHSLGCSEEELQQRDSAIAADRSVYEQRREKQMPLGPPLGRKIFVSNLRSKDGRKRVPKLTITDSSGVKFMTLSKRDFEQLMSWKEEITQELVKFDRKLS